MAIAASSHVVVKKGREVLLIRRADTGFWSTPGGRIEDNETFEQAALREVKEECGIVPNIIGISGVFCNPIWEKGIHSIVFAAEYSGVLPLSKTEEATEISFVGIHNLPGDILYWHVDYIHSAFANSILPNSVFNVRSPHIILNKSINYLGITNEDKEKLKGEFLKPRKISNKF